MKKHKPTVQQVPNMLPAFKPLDCKKRAYAHLSTSHGRRFHTLSSSKVTEFIR